MKRLAAVILVFALCLPLCACGSEGNIEYVEVPVEVEKIVEVPVEVEKIVEVPVEVEKIVEVPVEVEKTVEVIVEVEKIVEVPVEVEKIVEVPVEVEKTVEVPVEVEKIVEVPVEVEKIVEVPVEHVTTVYEGTPVTYTRREIIEMNGVEIPDGFNGDLENGTPVNLFARNTFSLLRSTPEDISTNITGYIYYYFETSRDTSSPDHIISHRVTVTQKAVSYGEYNGFMLVLWNGRFGWIKNNALSSSVVGNGNSYTVEITK